MAEGRGGAVRRCVRAVGAFAAAVIVAGALAGCVPRFDAGAELTASSYGAAVRIEWPAASDPDGGSIESYRVDVDGVEIARRPASLLRCDLAGLSAGSHLVTVTAYDDAGEWSGSNGADGALSAIVTPIAGAPDGAEPGCQAVYETTTVDVGAGRVLYVDVSADGREIAFITDAASVPGGGGSDDNGILDVFHRDLDTGVTTRITDGDARSDVVAMSEDGRYVVFGSAATNLVPGDVNATGDVFLWDRDAGTTSKVTGPLGGGGDGLSISGDGRFVGYDTRAALDPRDVNGALDAYLWDRTTGTSHLSAGSSGWDSYAWDVSTTGRAMAYSSFPIDGRREGYVWDRATDERIRIPQSQNCYWLRTSDDARIVVLQCNEGILRWDRATGESAALTRAATYSVLPLISADGNTVVFASRQADLTGTPIPAHTGIARYDARTRSSTWIGAASWSHPRMTPDGSVVVTGTSSGEVVLQRRVDLVGPA